MPKVDLREHLEKLVREWQERRAKGEDLTSLKNTCDLLGIGYLVSENDSAETVAENLVERLFDMGQYWDMEEYLEMSEEARSYDLWSLLSEFSPSSLD